MKRPTVFLLVGCSIAAPILVALGFELTTPRWTQEDRCEGAACVDACEHGSIPACAAAGDVFNDGDGVPRDAVRAEALYRKGCEAGGASACNKLVSRLRQLEKKSEADALEKRELDLASAGCKKKQLDDCRRLYFDLSRGWNEETKEGKDEVKAEKLGATIREAYRDFCDKGDALACMWTARFIAGFQDSRSRDAVERALPTYERACTLDRKRCWEWGSALHEVGQSGSAAFRMACDADSDGSSCWDPAHQIDAELAPKRLTKNEAACKSGKRDACLELVEDQRGLLSPSIATHEQKVAATAKVRELLEGECDRKMADSCARLAVILLFDERGEIVHGPVRLDIARLNERACDLGIQSSCSEVQMRPLLKDVETFFPGAFHHCARKTDGRVQCFGLTSDGAVGPSSEPSFGSAYLPLEEPATDVALTNWATAVLTPSGAVHVWGKPDVGGQKMTGQAYAALSGAVSIAAGRDDGLCVRFADGRVSCIVGSEEKPRDLEKAGATQIFPLNARTFCWRVAEGLRCSEDSVTHIAVHPDEGVWTASSEGICSLHANQTVSCAAVSLDGPTVQSIELEYVTDVANAVELSISGGHGCARIADGTIRCWELDKRLATRIEGIDDAIALKRACAATRRGIAFCWPPRGSEVPWGFAEPVQIEPGLTAE